MRTQVQRELDRAEEYILEKLFGNVSTPVVGPKIGLILNLSGISLIDYLNNKILEIENYLRDFMQDDGLLDGQKLSEALVEKYPVLNGISIPNLKPIEVAQLLGEMVDLDKVGYYVQNI